MDTRQVNAVVYGVAQKVANTEPGTVIHHEVLAAMFDLELPAEQGTYYRMVTKLKKTLMVEHGLFLHSVSRKGYSTAKRGEEIELCVGEWRSGLKKMYQGAKKTEFIDVDKIPDSTKKGETIMKAQKMANTLGMLKLGQGTKGGLLMNG